MLFSKFAVLAVTAFASVSWAKPLAQAHGAALSARGVHAAGAQVAKRGLLDLPILLPANVAGNTIPALLVNLNTNLGGLLDGNLNGDLNGTVPGDIGGLAGVTTDIEAIKDLIESAQALLADAIKALTGAVSGGSPLEIIAALTNVIKTVVNIITTVTGATKGLTQGDIPVVGDLPIVGGLPVDGTATDLPVDDLPVVGDLLATLTKTLASLISAILGQASQKAASLDLLKILLAPLVAIAAALFKSLGVDASPLTDAIGL